MCFFLSNLCYVSSVQAGTITLEINSTTRVTDQRINLEVDIKNSGTDTARNIGITAAFHSAKASAHVADFIVSHSSATAQLDFDIPENYRGTFPIFGNLTYDSPSGTTYESPFLAVARTADALPATYSVATEMGYANGQYGIRAFIPDSVQDIKQVVYTVHSIDDFFVPPVNQSAVVKDGAASAFFPLGDMHLPEGTQAIHVFVTAEYDADGLHYLSHIQTTIAPGSVTDIQAKAKHPFYLHYGLLFLLIVVLLVFIGIWVWKQKKDTPSARSQPGITGFDPPYGRFLDVLVLLAIEGFLLYHLAPGELITHTITTGGDTASHYYTVDYLQHYLLPHGRMTGWTPGNLCGFPLLQFYFPLPFLIMCGLNAAVPLTIAFKWVSLFGPFLMPIAAYGMFRSLKQPFPSPAIAAVFTLPFLFNQAHVAWGGNLLSTLAGEFSYGLSLSLSLILLGNLYRGCLENRHVILNGMLVFLVGFSHGYTLLYVEAVSLFFLITPRDFFHRLQYLFNVYFLGFLFLAFWLVPLLIFTKYTTAYHSAWHIHSISEVLSPMLLPFILLGCASLISYLILFFTPYRVQLSSVMTVFGLFLFSIGIAAVMYTAAPQIGVVDVRYIPIGQLMICLMGAMGLGQVIAKFRQWKVDGILLLILAAATMIWTNTDTHRVNGFARWNYEGFEKKPDWQLFQNINRVLSGSFQDPRVIYEHSSIHNRFGTMRAFESLPLFAGRATLEGVYMQASITAPFIFYIQSEISKEKSTPYKQYIYSDIDFDRARYHLSLFNVKELILISEQAKAAIRLAQGYRLKQAIDSYEIWELENLSYRYVVPLENEPILYQTDNWKIDAYRWFIDDRYRGVHLVFPMNFSKQDEALFKTSARSLENMERIPIDTDKAVIKETILEDRILIKTNWIGKPLLIKMSYHPNWRVEGAKKIYKISPSFMMIYPERETVRLIYGHSWPDWAGLALTGIGLVLLLLSVPPLRRRMERYGFDPTEPLPIFSIVGNRISWDPPQKTRRNLMIAGTVSLILILGGFSYHTFRNDTDRWFNRAVKLKDTKQYDAARALFGRIMQRAGSVSSLTSDAAYYIAICYFLEDRNTEAIGAFEQLIDRFPNGLRNQEALYHIGLCHFRLGEEEQAIDTMRQVRQRYPGTLWAGYAKERLLEHHAWTDQDGPMENLNPGEKMGQAMYLFNHNLLEEAQPVFKEIVEKYPLFQSAPQALACLALIHYKKNDCEKTIEYYQRLIDRYTDSPLVSEAYYHVGLCHEKTGNPAMAENAYKAVLDRYPESQWADYVREKMGN